jgi:uncharacterized phage-associated protein
MIDLPARYRQDLMPDVRKIVEAVLYVIRGHGAPTQYDIVKTLFLADREHLNRYGRPITFDNYTAMTHGPVPSLAYDMIKPTWEFERYVGQPCPWVSQPQGQGVNRFISTSRAPDNSVFSATDREELDKAIQVAKSLGFGQMRRLTHEDQAYIEAWTNRGEARANPMKLHLLLEEPDEDVADDLRYLSRM